MQDHQAKKSAMLRNLRGSSILSFVRRVATSNRSRGYWRSSRYQFSGIKVSERDELDFGVTEHLFDAGRLQETFGREQLGRDPQLRSALAAKSGNRSRLTRYRPPKDLAAGVFCGKACPRTSGSKDLEKPAEAAMETIYDLPDIVIAEGLFALRQAGLRDESRVECKGPTV